MKKRYLSIAASTVLVVGIILFAGCGGGGSGGTYNSESESSTIQGKAVDDLILNGIITVEDKYGNKLTEDRTNKTDGTYKLEVNYDGIVFLNVSCDENTTMYNPETNQTGNCPEGLMLHSLAKAAPGTDQNVSISPLTEAAYKRSLVLADNNQSKINESSLEQARSEIGLIFGIDPIAKDPTEGDYAKIINALHKAAEDSNISVFKLTQELAEELADGDANAGNENAVAAVTSKLKDENISNNLVEYNGTYAPPSNVANLSDVEQAKAMFNELRTEAMSVVDYKKSGTPGFLDTESQNFNKELNNVTININTIGEVLNIFYSDIEYIQENGLETGNILTKTDNTFKWSEVGENGENYNGTITVPTSILNGTVDFNSFTTLNIEVNGTFPTELYYSDSGPVASGTQNFQGSVTITKNSEGANITLAGTVSSNGATFMLNKASGEIGYSEINTTNSEPDYFKLNSIIVKGNDSNYTIDGNITVNNYVQNETLKNDSPDKITNSGWLPNSISFAGVISRNDKTASLEGIINALWKDANSSNITNNQYIPMVDVNISGKLKMPERPIMLVNIEFENNATNNIFSVNYSYDTTSIDLESLMDKEMKNGIVNISTYAGIQANIKIANGDIVTGSDENASKVTKDGALLGWFEYRDGATVIKYIDGSFESFP